MTNETLIERLRGAVSVLTLPAHRDAIAEVLRDAEEALSRPVEGWQDIASAPKDGRWLLLLMRNGQVWRASWGIDRSGEHVWCTDVLSLAGCVVTHWMPMPVVPAPPLVLTKTKGQDHE